MFQPHFWSVDDESIQKRFYFMWKNKCKILSRVSVFSKNKKIRIYYPWCWHEAVWFQLFIHIVNHKSRQDNLYECDSRRICPWNFTRCIIIIRSTCNNVKNAQYDILGIAGLTHNSNLCAIPQMFGIFMGTLMAGDAWLRFVKKNTSHRSSEIPWQQQAIQCLS